MEERFENAIESFFENTFGSLSLINEVVLSLVIAVVLIIIGISKINKGKSSGQIFIVLGVVTIFPCVIKLMVNLF